MCPVQLTTLGLVPAPTLTNIHSARWASQQPLDDKADPIEQLDVQTCAAYVKRYDELTGPLRAFARRRLLHSMSKELNALSRLFFALMQANYTVRGLSMSVPDDRYAAKAHFMLCLASGEPAYEIMIELYEEDYFALVVKLAGFRSQGLAREGHLGQLPRIFADAINEIVDNWDAREYDEVDEP